MNTKEFVFNENDICMNPDVIFRSTDETKGYAAQHFKITTACDNDKWTWGYDIWIHDQGGGCGAGRGSFEKKFATEKEAIKDACNFLRKYLKRNEFDYSGTKRLWDKKLMVMLNEVEHPRPVELDLFS